MTTKRFYSGARDNIHGGPAAQLMKMQIQKGGKLPMTSAERYKHLMKKKMEEHRQKAALNPRSSFSLKGSVASFKMSKRAEDALKQIAQKKAMKEAKAMRQMVAIIPRNYGNGRLDSKGNVYDEANNLVMKVNGKKGIIMTTTGWKVGKYRPKKLSHNSMMRDAILKYSPYHIRLRQLQLQQQVAAMYAMQQTGMVTSYGTADEITALSVNLSAPVSDRADGYQRSNMGVSAWGVRSNNVLGTFGENVHGTFGDNAWGGVSTDIWGGLGTTGSNSIWGNKSMNIWNSGRPGQKNYIGIWSSMGLAWLGRFVGGLSGRLGNPRRVQARSGKR